MTGYRISSEKIGCNGKRETLRDDFEIYWIIRSEGKGATYGSRTF
jgi:hypothetical protein